MVAPDIVQKQGVVEAFLKRHGFTCAGHPEDELSVGIHTIGYVGETTQDAAETLYPGYEVVFSRIGRERGWPSSPQRQFDSSRGPDGALMVGSPEDIATKILQVNKDLGGIDRVTIQIDGAMVGHENLLAAINRLGGEVRPYLPPRNLLLKAG